MYDLKKIPHTDLLRQAQSSAVHLEMRDTYTPQDPVFLDWKQGRMGDPIQRMRDWYDLVVETVGRGVVMRRARIVSEPVTDFIRHEYDLATQMNIPAGEQVRWLPRRFASDLCLPGNDFWVIDSRLVRFGYFSGDGDVHGHELLDDPGVVGLCVSAFEAVWERATPHEEYKIV